MGSCDRTGCNREGGDRGSCDGIDCNRGSNNSFKSKLLGMASSNSWKGFGTRKKRLQIEDGDIVFTEGPYGPDVLLSDELKAKLRKPWTNSSGPTTIGAVRARGTGVIFEKSRNIKGTGKNASVNKEIIGKGSRFEVLADSVEEENVPRVDHKLKGKSPMVMTGGGDATLAKSSSVFIDISNMGPLPYKEVAGIKSGSLKSVQKTSKTKKASYAKQRLKCISKGLGQLTQKAPDKGP
ncbi:hypothetical protein ACOSQ4_020836 [Xanthoceras sorbifolium]